MVRDIASTAEVESLITAGDRHVIVNVWATWAAPCKQMSGVFRTLSSANEDAERAPAFLSLDFDNSSDVADRWNVSSLPTFLFFEAKSGKEMGRVEGADVPGLRRAVQQVMDGTLGTETGGTTDERLQELVARDKVMLFMKGCPEAPKCGFSRQIVDILNKQGVVFGHFDILEDQEVRAGLKVLSEWPTYPQLYSAGQFIGGIDIVKELVDDDALIDELETAQNNKGKETTA